jgi:5-methylcytosine-specific restriction enzyme A
MSALTERGSTWAWRRLRAEVLERDAYTCPCGAPATTVDHILPRARGGTDALDNLQAMCGPCNYAKGARTSPTRRSARPSRSW